MLKTALTQRWGLRVPIVGAPMSPMSGGRLAGAVSAAGGLGMIGVSSTQPAGQLERDFAELRALAPSAPFGIGLMVWALDARPDLLESTLAAKPFAIALSFGDPSPFVPKVRAAGAVAVAQVQDGESAALAERASVDVLVAQGTEAGGHTGGVGTLPLLQIVLERTKLPVLAAGGIAHGRGLAAVLAAGAQGAWIGTPLLVAEEARNSADARRRVIDANESGTIYTRVFDVAQGIPWPTRYAGRALANGFTERWHGHEADLEQDEGARRALRDARKAEDYAQANLYAGQSVGLLERVEPAAVILERIAHEAESRLRGLSGLID